MQRKFTKITNILKRTIRINWVLAGTVAAWYVVNQIMGFEFTVLPTIAGAAVLIALTVTIGLGLAGTWRILSVKAAPYLRNM